MAKNEKEFVFFDYLTFTVRLQEFGKIFDLLGISEALFEFRAGGTNHYEATYICNNTITVKKWTMDYKSRLKYGFEHSEGYEINVQISGKGIRQYKDISYGEFESCFDMILNLRKEVDLINFTRVDFTRDDVHGHLILDDIEKKLEKGEYISRLPFNTISSLYDTDKKRYYGKTIYLGSKKTGSEFYIRLYNKSAEEYTKLKFLGKDKLEEHKTRVEMVFRKKQAMELMSLIFEKVDKGESLGELYSSLLLGKFKLLKRGKKKEDFHGKLDRILKNLCPKFKKFLDTTNVAKLGIERNKSNFESKIKHAEVTFAKTLAMYKFAFGKDEMIRWILEIAQNGQGKMTHEDFLDINDFLRELEFDESENEKRNLDVRSSEISDKN